MTAVADAGVWMSELERMPDVGLDTLCQEAALLHRVDRKYLVEPEHADSVVRFLASDGARALEIEGNRQFTYVSDYFDTPSLSLYRDAATGRRRRFKLRERVYVDSGLHFLELKTRGKRGVNVKDRHELAPRSLAQCRAIVSDKAGHSSVPLYTDPCSFQWVSSMLTERGVAQDSSAAVALIGGLSPVLRSTYQRSTILTPDGSRVTLDAGLDLMAYPDAVGEGVVARPSSHPTAPLPLIIETKSVGGVSAADRFLWSEGIRPSRVSKYAVGIAQAYTVSANRWTRTLKAIGVQR